MNYNPYFITIEGVDGAGKTSHVEALLTHIRARISEFKNISDVVHTREPGGSPFAEALRSVLLDPNNHIPVSAEAETMAMFTGRKDHLDHVILPALEQQKIVICDRFSDSTWAYQHGGKNVSADFISSLEQITHPKLQPGLTILFDLPVEVSLARLQGTSKIPDRFESQNSDFFNQVRQTYLKRASLRPSHFAIIDSNRSIDLIRQDVLNIIDHHLLTYFSPILSRKRHP